MEQGNIDYKLLLRRTLKYWYLFAVLIAVFVLGAHYYLDYIEPVYESNTLILVEDEKDSKQLSEETLFSELGFGKVNNNMVNEMMILESSPLLKEVVEKLGLQYRYFKIDGWIKREMYKTSPVKIVSWDPKPGQDWLYGVVTENGPGGFNLSIEDEENDEINNYTGEFGKALNLPTGVVTLFKEGDTKGFGEIAVLAMPTGSMAGQLKGNINVEFAEEKASVLRISLEDVAPERIHDVLTEIVEVYNQRSVNEKNQVFSNTIDLINNRIELIVDELSEAEQDVESYKRRFNMTELSSEGTLLMNELSSYNKEIAGTELQLEILNSIEKFLEANRNNFEFVPTNVSINNLTLTSQLESFNRLLSERDRLRSDLGPSHPDLLVIEKQIRNLRETIIENVGAMKNDLLLARNSTQNVKDNLQTRLQTLPRRERELIEIERQKSVKENLYLYLLQKREETAISLAVTKARAKVVEPPYIPNDPIKPNRPQIMIIAFSMGFAIPAGIVLLIFFLNDKIEVEDDLEGATSLPVAGLIAQSRKKGRLVVKENSRSVTAEMFRMLRANLSYIASGENMKVMLITSGVSGEGKSFVALNLGVIQALAGKKTVILELDLRKPKQELYGEASKNKINELGVVNYLVDPNLSVDNIITNSGAHPHLDIIRCGPKPPNPSELILSHRLRELVNILKAHYDFIIIDAPPVGLVADPLQMKDLADATMFVLRAGYSRKPELQLINDITEKDKLPRPFIVLNGVRSGGSGYSGYNYGYGYGYGHQGYYEEEDTKGILSRFFQKKNKKTVSTVSPINKVNGKSQNGVPSKEEAEKLNN